MLSWLIAAGAAVVTYLLCRLLAHPRLGPRILDRPGARSLHDRPTPRTGGLAMLAALVLGALVARGAGLALWLDAPVVLAALLLAGVSFVDDVRGLHVAVRFPVHAAAAAVLLVAGYAPAVLHVPGLGAVPLGAFGGVLAFLFIVWMTNLYNFMDGMDGFAAGMGVIGFGALAAIGHAQGHAGYALAALLVAAVNAGFLVVNFPPARLFMGDIGAVPMGFLAAAFALAGVRLGLFALWVPVLVFSTFILDATATLFRRLLRGERVWQAHREHYYQRLVLLGWGHRKTALASYAIMIASAGTAVLLAARGGSSAEWIAALAWCLIYLVLALLIGRMEQRHRRHTEESAS